MFFQVSFIQVSIYLPMYTENDLLLIVLYAFSNVLIHSEEIENQGTIRDNTNHSQQNTPRVERTGGD